jgi:hypothetical protein
MKRRMGFMAAFAMLALVAAACGGGGGKTTQSPGTTRPSTQATSQASAPPQAIGFVSRSDVEACLTAAGLKVATGDTPLISGAQGIGINPGEGSLMPGNVTGAVFVYSSDAEATSAAAALAGFAVSDVVHEGNILVVYANPPTADDRSAIERCTSEG